MISIIGFCKTKLKKLSRKNILIVSPENWNHIFVSKHHYAVHLAKRSNNVFFLNPPSHRLKSTATDYTNLFQLDYQGFWPGLRYMPRFLQKINIRSVFNRLQKMVGGKFDIIWSFDNSVFFDFDALPDQVFKICHIVDLNQNFQFVKAAKSASICLTSSTHILQKLKLSNPNSHFINHGLNIDYDDVQVKLPGTGKIKALYFGNLAMAYLDWEIIEQAVKSRPDVDFIFMGSNQENFDLTLNPMHQSKLKLLNVKNVYFLPKVPSRELLSYMNVADLLFVAYQQKFHRDQANPHKMMEYLYSGKPIVATFTEEYQQFHDLIQMSVNNTDWHKIFSDTVDKIDQLSDEQMMDKRRHIALENTYDDQLNRINDLING